MRIDDKSLSWLNGILPFPKPDVNGKCNFFAGASFMETASSQCTTVVTDFERSCQTLLNPKFLVDNISVKAGTDLIKSVEGGL
jgi:hypothetical protein